MLPWVSMCKFLCGHRFSVLLTRYLGVESLGHVVTLYLTFWETATLWSTVAAPFYTSTSDIWGFQSSRILAHIWYGLSSLTTIFLPGVECYLIVVLICISLMANDIDQLFMGFLIHSCIFLGKILRYFVQTLFNWVICFLIIELQEFFIYSENKPLTRSMICTYFLLSRRLSFCFPANAIPSTEVCKLIGVQFICFFHLLLVLQCHIWEAIIYPKATKLPLCFLLRVW